MMNLKLSEEQRKTLAETLDSSLTSLSDEIHHTDTFEYRELLKERRETLTEIRKLLH